MATTYSTSSGSRDYDVRAAAGVNDAFIAVGRLLLALIFISSGLEKFMGLAETTAEIASKNLPMPHALAIVSAASSLAAGC